jgi:hypothetical protein
VVGEKTQDAFQFRLLGFSAAWRRNLSRLTWLPRLNLCGLAALTTGSQPLRMSGFDS